MSEAARPEREGDAPQASTVDVRWTCAVCGVVEHVEVLDEDVLDAVTRSRAAFARHMVERHGGFA